GAHVLVRIPETGGSEGEDKTRAKVAEVIKRAKAGEDFGQLAREISEDPGSKQNGGDLGLVRKGEMVPQFEQAAFALKAGEISSEPVRTPFGFHAIKVNEVNPGGKTPLKEVAAQIRDRISATDAERAAKTKADEARAKLIGAADFSAEARRLGLTPTDLTIPKTEQAGAGGADTMAQATFELTVDGLSQPVKTPAGWVVIKSRETLPPAVPPLAEIKDRASTALKRERAEGLALERAKQLAAAAKGGDFGAAAKQAGATTGETPRFSIAKPAEKVPGDALLAAFQTPIGATSEPVKTPQGYYVMKVLERVPADPSGFHTAALTFRLFWQLGALTNGSIGSPGLDELRWLKPVRPGDTLHVNAKVVEIRRSTSKPDRGAVKIAYTTVNQHGEAVMTL